jgi:hypothetical protein
VAVGNPYGENTLSDKRFNDGDDQPKHDIQGDSDAAETALEAAAGLSTMLALLPSALGPVGGVIGGVLAQVLEGIASDRKMQRLAETVALLRNELEALVKVQDDYVRSEDFEDLTEKALRQASDERHSEKRRLYARFISGLATSPPATYDERRQQLRTLDELQLRHVDVLMVLAAVKDETIAAKLSPDQRGEAPFIELGRHDWVHENHEILDQLIAMGLARTATRSGAVRLRERRGEQKVEGGRIKTFPQITEYGMRFVEFVASDANE